MNKIKKELDQNNASREVMEANRAAGDHSIQYGEAIFTIHKNVFSPAIFNGWQPFTTELSKLELRGKSMLEVGAGSGITGLSLLLEQELKSLVLADINPMAVANCRENIRSLSLSNKAEAIQSDVFDQIPKGFRFDLIYWNHPWILERPEYEYMDELDKGLFDPGYKYLEKYVAGLKERLNPGGKSFLGFGDFGDISKLGKIAHKHGFEAKITKQEAGMENGKVEFILYELQKT